MQDQDQDQDQKYMTKTKTEAGLRPVLSYDRGLRPQDWHLPSGCFRCDGDGVVSVDNVSSADSDDASLLVTVVVSGRAAVHKWRNI